MPSLLRTIEEPQDIYILSYCSHKVGDDDCVTMGITDDYCTYDIITEDGKELVHSESGGMIHIFTKEELLKVAKLIGEDEVFEEHGGLSDGLPALDEDKYGVILRNFSGTINASLRDDTGKCYLNKYDVKTMCYIQYEGTDHDRPDGWSDPYLVVPDGTVAEHVHLFQILDEITGNTGYLSLPPLTKQHEFIHAVEFIYNTYGDSWFTNYKFGTLFHKLFLNGFLLGYLGTKYTSYVNETANLFANKKDPGFDRIVGFTTDLNERAQILGKFIFLTDVYKQRFNEFYKPLRRQKIEYEDSTD